MSAPAPHAVITGATNGLGRFIARGLVLAGYDLTLIARDAAKAAATRDWLAGIRPGVTVEILRADLSLLAETRAAGEAIRARHPAIALLVNNAGLLVPQRRQTAEGHEVTLATNLLSPLALTETLLPALAAGAPARVVMTGSSSADLAGIDPDNLELTQGWGKLRAYARSKLALLIMSRTWAPRLMAQGITLNLVHPGLVRTDILRHGGVEGIAWKLIGLFSLSPEDGAKAPLHACLAPELAGRTGLYLKPGGEAKPNPRVQDAALVARVEAAVMRLLAASDSAAPG
ncbi:SDR family NAD(P)-dependent oxidoreductase [Acidisoma sp. C75]